jgi:hypothetical protein
MLVEARKNAHHEIGAIDLRGLFLRLLRDGVHFHCSILYWFSSLICSAVNVTAFGTIPAGNDIIPYIGMRIHSGPLFNSFSISWGALLMKLQPKETIWR